MNIDSQILMLYWMSLPGLISNSGTTNYFDTVAPDTGDEENRIASNENDDTRIPRRGNPIVKTRNKSNSRTRLLKSILQAVTYLVDRG